MLIGSIGSIQLYANLYLFWLNDLGFVLLRKYKYYFITLFINLKPKKSQIVKFVQINLESNQLIISVDVPYAAVAVVLGY